jgi:glucosamine 6-phosphate synthetase-like amidotransferase/phosphosugar isomerase protein
MSSRVPGSTSIDSNRRQAALIHPPLRLLRQRQLAQHVASHRGPDVDQPWNLAKNVTVE